MEKITCAWLVIITVISACTCGVRTACNGPTQISVLTGVHDDPACRKLSSKGVMLFEAARFLTEAHNNKTNGYKIDLAVMDTCGSIAGAMKASMRALVKADVNCLQPPFHLGIIGPDTITNAEAVQKVTSVLRIPHILRKASNSPFMHYMPKESDAYIVRGIMKVLHALNWKTFTLVAQNNDDNDDDVQNIAKKLTMEAISKGLCVLVHDHDEDDYSSKIVHIGKPSNGLFTGSMNASILVVSEGNLEGYLNRVNSTNSILLLEDARTDFDGLEQRVQRSRWWNEDGAGTYDTEEMRDVRWLQDALDVYTKALDVLCKKKKCKGQVNPTDWNNIIVNVLSAKVAEEDSSTRGLDLSLKTRNTKLNNLGRLKITKTKANMAWGASDDDDDDDFSNDDDEEEGDTGHVPKTFKRLISKQKESRSGCATSTKEMKSSIDNDDDDDNSHVFVSEMEESEWWTMVMTVSGVGVAMFSVGILAVYIVYSNIRGPRGSKNVERDNSLRRVGSDRRPTLTQRVLRSNPRRESNRSIQSNVSEKSV